MPAHDETKKSAQKDLLQELRELQTVLDSEADDAIPTLSDVVQVEHTPSAETHLENLAAETLTTTEDPDPVDAPLDDEPNSDDDSIPVLESVASDDDAENDTAEPAASEQSLDQLLAAEATKSAPFALIDNAANDYDTSTAESLIEDGLNEALQPLTEQMDDEALRLVDELVAEHAELIRQQLKQRLDEKSRELRTRLD